MLALLNRRSKTASDASKQQQQQHHRQQSIRQRSPRPRGGSRRYKEHQHNAYYQQQLQAQEQVQVQQQQQQQQQQRIHPNYYNGNASPHHSSGSYSDYEGHQCHQYEDRDRAYNHTDDRPSSTNSSYVHSASPHVPKQQCQKKRHSNI